jgi:DNA invertase Pin-like site-specific DNA recombinase
MEKEVRAAIYARVSTTHQDEANQIPDIEKYLAIRGWKVDPEYIFRERRSGKRADREEYQRMLRFIRQRKISTVLCWKLNRLGRSASELLTRLNEFRELGVDFISVSEGFDTSTATGRLHYGFLSLIAEFENEARSEAIRAGIARVKSTQARTGRIATRSGKPLGRPQVPVEKSKEVRRLREAGQSLRQICEATKLAKNTVRRVIRAG